ncbi:MAG: hypothetical protein ABI955_08090 [Nitrospirota bacterium]
MRGKVRKGKKKLIRSSKSVSDHDATNTKWLDEILEMTDQAQKVMAYAAAHPKHLSVPDAQTEKAFIDEAKRVYREAHIPTLKRGPRPKEATTIHYLKKLSDELGQGLTQYKMIKSLIDDNICSINTAGKYAKLYRFSCLSGEDRAQLSQADQQWLRKNFGSESLSPTWWMDRSWQWIEETVAKSGLGEEIRKIFSKEYSEMELRQQREEMERLRRQQIKKAADQRQQSKDVPTKESAYVER